MLLPDEHEILVVSRRSPGAVALPFRAGLVAVSREYCSCLGGEEVLGQPDFALIKQPNLNLQVTLIEDLPLAVAHYDREVCGGVCDDESCCWCSHEECEDL